MVSGARARDIWVVDLERGSLSRLTFGGADSDPVWTPDGRRIAYASEAERPHQCDLYWVAADGSDEPQLLLSTETKAFPTSISPDGRFLAFSRREAETRADIWILSLEGEHEPKPLLHARFNEFGAKFSPDGRWIAYVSDESGREEVYVRAFPGPGGKVQISTSGGTSPVWSPGGRGLFFRSGQALLAVNVSPGDTLRPSVPRVLFQGAFEEFGDMYNSCNYDVSPDGHRFLMIRNEEEVAATRIDIVLDWFEELKARLPARGA
jgi:Tol biopolymer transport system component